MCSNTLMAESQVNIGFGQSQQVDHLYKVVPFCEKTSEGYQKLFKSFDEAREKRAQVVDISKVLLRQRITGGWSRGAYLDSNDQRGGVTCPDEILRTDLKKEIEKTRFCGRKNVWLRGEETGLYYSVLIRCGKQWCPICGGSSKRGGRKGLVHERRKSSILRRIDTKQIGLRQFIFTLPDVLWGEFASKDKLNQMFAASKRLVERFFGEHLKGEKYKLNYGVIAYLHVFGDKETGVFKPHINVHLVEARGTDLFLAKEVIDAMRKSWRRALRGLGYSNNSVNCHYSYANTERKILHKIRYMCRPWSEKDFFSADEKTQQLLALDLKSFQYLRFWGALANCNYKDGEFFPGQTEPERTIKENLKILTTYDYEKEKIVPIVSDWVPEAWGDALELVDCDFYFINREKLKKNKDLERMLEGLDRCQVGGVQYYQNSNDFNNVNVEYNEEWGKKLGIN